MKRLHPPSALLLLALLLGGCGGERPNWRMNPGASPSAVEAALASNPYYPYFWDTHRDQIPKFSPPAHLRPCCIFGVDVRSRLGVIPVPMYRVANITAVERLGPHVYDAGFMGRGSDKEVKALERNGLIYTCQGGFIDTAHVRDYADWTVYLSTWVSRHLGERAQMQFHPELGPRTVRLSRIDISGLDPAETMILATSVAQYLAYQISAWHEIAQWHGYRVIELFPELASAYSIEDLYSNVLGTKIAAAMIYGGLVSTDRDYARAMDVWLVNAISALGPVSRGSGRRLTQALDQYWWDSTARVPDKWLVLARHYDTGLVQLPPRIPAGTSDTTDRLLQEVCDEEAAPLTLAVDEQVLGYRMRDIATLEIRIDDASARTFTFPSPRHAADRLITQDDFARIARMNQDRDRLELAELGWRQDEEARSRGLIGILRAMLPSAGSDAGDGAGERAGDQQGDAAAQDAPEPTARPSPAAP